MQRPEQFATRGVNGTVFVTPDRIVVRRKRGLLAIMSQGLKRTTEHAFPIDQVVGAQLKPATAFVNRYIRLSILGQAEWAKELVDRYREAAREDAPTTSG